MEGRAMGELKSKIGKFIEQKRIQNRKKKRPNIHPAYLGLLPFFRESLLFGNHKYLHTAWYFLKSLQSIACTARLPLNIYCSVIDGDPLVLQFLVEQIIHPAMACFLRTGSPVESKIQDFFLDDLLERSSPMGKSYLEIYSKKATTPCNHQIKMGAWLQPLPHFSGTNLIAMSPTLSALRVRVWLRQLFSNLHFYWTLFPIKVG